MPAGYAQMGPFTGNGNDDYVTGTVGPPPPPLLPGQDRDIWVNISINSPPTPPAAPATVTIDAVVVKGGDGYNVYYPPHVPPAEAYPQRYISPFDGGGNIPTISHWFVCYHYAETPPTTTTTTQPPGPTTTTTSAPPTGSLAVSKQILAQRGRAHAAPRSSYTAIANCNDSNSAHHNVTITFDSGGGVGTPVLTGIPLGTICTVVEQNSASFPPGSTVSYEPTNANTAGVTIGSATTVSVMIVNNFAHTASQTGNLTVKKFVENPNGVAVPGSFTAHVKCNDNVIDNDVTMPGGGGLGTPTLHPLVGFDCQVQEVSVPAGWSVRYSVGGSPLSPVPPIVSISSATQVIEVDITNYAPGAPAPPPTTTTIGPYNPTTPTYPGGGHIVTTTTTATHHGPSFVPGSGGTGDSPPPGGFSPWAIAVLSGLGLLSIGAALEILRRRSRHAD